MAGMNHQTMGGLLLFYQHYSARGDAMSILLHGSYRVQLVEVTLLAFQREEISNSESATQPGVSGSNFVSKGSIQNGGTFVNPPRIFYMFPMNYDSITKLVDMGVSTSRDTPQK